MINLMTEAAEAVQVNWGAVILQALATAGLVFGGAGFWEFVKTRFIAKREDKQAEADLDDKFSMISNQVTELKTQVTGVGDKVDDMSEDLQELKHDIALLQQANEATVKYRKMRDEQDKDAAKSQRAVINSLRGMIRDRLLETYERCMEKGYYTHEERETYGELFKCYEEPPFEGNGVMHQLQPRMQALPWTADEANNKGTN